MHTGSNQDFSFDAAERARLAAIDEMLSIIHHELKSPISVMYGYAATLINAARALDTDAVVEAAAAVQRAASGMNALVSTFKDSRDLGRGLMELELEDFLASQLVVETVADMQTIAKEHAITISVTDDALLRGDSIRIRQVLVNLLANSTKFAPTGTLIDISVEREGDSLAIRCTDEGPGIPPERVNELFQKFSKLGSKGPGVGLGLFLSRAIARAHEGDLELEVAEGDLGCRFKLTLPIHADAVTMSLALDDQHRPR